MANVFLDLPLPALNGPGAAVDVSAMGKIRTVTVVGEFVGATVTVEVSNSGAAGDYAPILTFQNGEEKKTVEVAAQFARVVVSGRKNSVPFSANIYMAANDNGTQVASLPMPALNGPGASINTAMLGTFNSFVAGGTFAGAAILVEASEDGVDWTPCVQFSSAGGIK